MLFTKLYKLLRKTTAGDDVKSTHKVEIVRLGPILKHSNADTLGIVKVWGYQCVVKLDDWHEGDLAAYIQPDSIVPQTEEFEFLIPPEHGKQWHHKYQRITARKFRGERSEGLLMKPPKWAKEGDNVAERMGVTRYVSPAERREIDAAARLSLWGRINNRGRRGLSFGGNERGPSIWIPVYDLENYFRYGNMYEPGATLERGGGDEASELVGGGTATTAAQPSDVSSIKSFAGIQEKEADSLAAGLGRGSSAEGSPVEVAITEKIHGCNARFVFSSDDDRLFCGSRTTWKRPFYPRPGSTRLRQVLEWLRICKSGSIPATDDWNRLLRTTNAGERIAEWCKAHPDHVLFGEIYGIQDLRYGLQPGELEFVGFDVFYKGEWWSWDEVYTSLTKFGVPCVPVLYTGPFSDSEVRACCNGTTRLGTDRKQIREGCVVRPLHDKRLCTLRGYPARRILKAVSSAYLERASKDDNPQPNMGG